MIDSLSSVSTVVVSQRLDMAALVRRMHPGRVSLCADMVAARVSLTSDVRLILIGPDIAHDVVADSVAHIRDKAPGIFIVWLGERDDVAKLSLIARLVDTVLVVPDDVGVAEDLVRGTFARDQRRHSLRPLFQTVGGFALFLIVWQTLVGVFHVPKYLAPPPTAVISELGRAPWGYLTHTAITAFEAALGFVAGNLAGFTVAVFLHRYVIVQRLSLPVLIGLQAVPIVAIAPLLIVWFGSGLVSKVAMATIICFFPMVVNTLQAFAAVDREARDLFVLYRASFLATLRMLLVPAALPSLEAALRISAGLAVVGAIVAELTGADRGLGYILLNASYRLETDRLFAAMVLAGGLGTAFYAMPGMMFRRRPVNEAERS